MDNRSLITGLLLGAGAFYLYNRSRRPGRALGNRYAAQAPRYALPQPQIQVGPAQALPPQAMYQQQAPARPPIHHSQAQAPPPPPPPEHPDTEGTLGGERF